MTTNKTLTIKSIYVAAYLMTQYDKQLIGTEMDKKQIRFLFNSDGTEAQAMREFSGQDVSEKSRVQIADYIKCVNKLKDVIKSLSREDAYPSY